MLFLVLVCSTVDFFLVNVWYCNVFNCIVICLELYLEWINESMKTEN